MRWTFGEVVRVTVQLGVQSALDTLGLDQNRKKCRNGNERMQKNIQNLNKTLHNNNTNTQ